MPVSVGEADGRHFHAFANSKLLPYQYCSEKYRMMQTTGHCCMLEYVLKMCGHPAPLDMLPTAHVTAPGLAQETASEALQ
jgi:hypothetical protein